MRSFIFIIITIVFILPSCKKQSSTDQSSDAVVEERENYGTGQTSRTYTRVNGQIEGKMTDYYPSGAIKGERWFVTNQQHGKTTLYYEGGQIKEVQYYIHGKRTGGDTLFYETGKLQYVSEFKEDKKNGYLRKWDEEGKLIYEARFVNDSLTEVMGQSLQKNER
ncbi:MAG: hypothetical protein LW630_11585 [Saprospiraceae bacterium]|nr:hypothetical protein [Saprospiraceae bacterium]